MLKNSRKWFEKIFKLDVFRRKP